MSSSTSKIQLNTSSIISNDEQEEFKRILTFLHEHSNGHIEEDITISFAYYPERNEYPFESKNELFNENELLASAEVLNSWLCFDFKRVRNFKHGRIIV